MAITGSAITKSGIISDFITQVMNPNAGLSGLHSGNIPYVNIRMWDNGSVISAPYTYYAAGPLYVFSTNTYSNPTSANIGDTVITASTILNVCLTYAQTLTRIRNAIWGLYYTQYYNGSYVRTGVPSDNPYAHASGAISGTFGLTSGYAHLNNNYLQSLPSSITNQPLRGATISAPNINDFYSRLRTAVVNLRNNAATIDLRVCHSSCHNNCHSSRGRR